MSAFLLRNRLTLAILRGSPLVILAMFLMLFRAGAFEPATASPSTSLMVLFWIAFGGFFFGLTYGLLQICTELPIVRREPIPAGWSGDWRWRRRWSTARHCWYSTNRRWGWIPSRATASGRTC